MHAISDAKTMSIERIKRFLEYEERPARRLTGAGRSINVKPFRSADYLGGLTPQEPSLLKVISPST